MIITILIITGFIVMLIAPFIIGLVELLRPRDAKPLFIDMKYTKDPRYFGKSFKKLIKKALDGVELSSGVKEVKLSKDETVEICGDTKVFTGEEGGHIYYVRGNFIASGNTNFQKEIYVTGYAAIGRETTLRAVACEGDVFIAGKATIIRWVDSIGNMEICRDCTLGISVSSSRMLRVSGNCRFKRLYGLPVITVEDIPIVNRPVEGQDVSGTDAGETPGGKELQEISDTAWIVHEKYTVIPAGTRIDHDFITRNDLKIKNNCTVNGNIKTYKGLVLEKNVNIFGNIFAEEDVEIGSGAVVLGNIFTQGNVRIRQHAEIGKAGVFKSVIGKKGIVLDKNVTIYGYVMTEGSGIITE